MNNQNLDEAADRAFKVLVERFGRPIGDSPTTVGVPDERSKSADINEIAPEGYEKVVKALKRDKKVKNPWAVAWSMKNKKEN